MEATQQQQFKMYCNSPAGAPQLVQDQFGQIVAPVPGLSKLEYIASAIYQHGGIDAAEAIDKAEELLAEIFLRNIRDTEDAKLITLKPE